MTHPVRDHRLEAERWLERADAPEDYQKTEDRLVFALVGIGHALLASQDPPPPTQVIQLKGNPTQADIDRLKAQLKEQP